MGCASSSSKNGPDLRERFKGARRLSHMETHLGYFCDTDMAKKFISKYSDLMLFPWEYQRAMGIVKLANPMALRYTFLSHQWENSGHPFPDLKQVSEHLQGQPRPATPGSSYPPLVKSCSRRVGPRREVRWVSRLIWESVREVKKTFARWVCFP